MNEELLIECVRKNEFLYKPKHKDHCNQRLAKNCWDNIGTTMGQTGKNNAYYSLGRVVKDFSHCQGTDPTSDTKYCFIASQIWKAALGLFRQLLACLYTLQIFQVFQVPPIAMHSYHLSNNCVEQWLQE